MIEPALIIMAAGMGSRYGGCKQMEPVDQAGHSIIDFSMYDAKRAGFKTVICVIAPGMEADFHEKIGRRVSSHLQLYTVLQQPNMLPSGFKRPEGRKKPWGTAHAVLSAKELADGPFAVINADDFYGADAFRQIYAFLTEQAGPAHHAMVGYKIENTLTEHGSVSRGICETNGSKLRGVVERLHVVPRPGGAAYFENGIENGIENFIPAGTIVSMNLWGFGPGIMEEIEHRFSAFLSDNLASHPLTCEYYLPLVTNALLRENIAEINVLKTSEKWMGVTYLEDMPVLRAEIARMKADGCYPDLLWPENGS